MLGHVVCGLHLVPSIHAFIEVNVTTCGVYLVPPMHAWIGVHVRTCGMWYALSNLNACSYRSHRFDMW